MKYTAKKIIAFLLMLTMMLNIAPINVSAGTNSSGNTRVGSQPPLTISFTATEGLSNLGQYYLLLSADDNSAPIAYCPLNETPLTLKSIENTETTVQANSSNTLYIVYSSDSTETFKTIAYKDLGNIGHIKISETGTRDVNLGTYHFHWTYSDTGCNISVTNAYTAAIKLQKEDGTVDTSATIPTDTKYYAVFSVNNNGNNYYCIKEYGAPQDGWMTVSLTNGDKFKNKDDLEGVSLPANQQPQVEVYEYTGTGDFETEFLNSPYYIDYGRGKALSSESMIGLYQVTIPSNKQYSSETTEITWTATKQPSYDVKIVFVDENNVPLETDPTGLPSDYSLLVTQQLERDNNGGIRPYIYKVDMSI